MSNERMLKEKKLREDRKTNSEKLVINSAADDWNYLPPYEVKRRILRDMGYNLTGNLDWNSLPKEVQEKLRNVYVLRYGKRTIKYVEG